MVGFYKLPVAYSKRKSIRLLLLQSVGQRAKPTYITSRDGPQAIDYRASLPITDEGMLCGDLTFVIYCYDSSKRWPREHKRTGHVQTERNSARSRSNRQLCIMSGAKLLTNTEGLSGGEKEI
jgi:hypothetical protein